MTTSICNPSFLTTLHDKFLHDHIHSEPNFRDYPFMTNIYCDHLFHNHCLLKFPRPQNSNVRHPDVHRTHATPFPYDSHQRRKLLETIFLPVVILNRHEIPHHLDSPLVAMMK